MRQRYPVKFLACLLFLSVTGCSVFQTKPTSHTKDLTTFPPLLLLIDSDDEGDGLQIRPIDSTSLEDRPGYRPIDFGHVSVYTISPDGQTLAAIVWPGDTSSGGALHLIDLALWQEHPTSVRFDAYVNQLEFTPDSKYLYWMAPTSTSSLHGLPEDYELYRYNLTDQQVNVLLPIPFTPFDARLLSDGSRLAVYGVPTDVSNLAVDWPHVMIIDLAAKKILADIQLDGVTDWQRQVNKTGEEPEYQLDRAGLAWDIDRDLLYVVHATEDKVMIVDLSQAKIQEEARIQPQLSYFTRFLTLFATSAYAKAVPGTDRHSVLSTDGTHLYIVGMRRELDDQPDGRATWREIPLGLQMVETGSIREIRRLDLPVDTLSLSPNGERLLLTGSQYETIFNEAYLAKESGLYVLDAKNLAEIFRLNPPKDKFSLHGFSPDSRYAYFSSFNPDAAGDIHLQVLDLETLRFLGARSFPQGSLGLLGAIWSGN